MSIVQPTADYTTQQQQEENQYKGVNEFGTAMSTLGTLGIAALALGAGRGPKGSRNPKGLGKSTASPTTGIPQSQFSSSGLSRRNSGTDLQMESLANIGLTRSARTPYGPVKRNTDTVGTFAKNLGTAMNAGKKGVAKVAKKVKGAYRKATADPFSNTNVFQGKGPNEMRERTRARPALHPRRRTRGVPTPFTQAGYRTV